MIIVLKINYFFDSELELEFALRVSYHLLVKGIKFHDFQKFQLKNHLFLNDESMVNMV